jgi:hypothetical protein
MSMPFKQLQSPPPVKPATRGEVFEFLRGLQEFRRKGDEPFNEQAIADYLAQQPLGLQQSIARRIMMDILKSPTADPSPAVPPKGERSKGTPAKKQKASSGAKTAPPAKNSPRATAPRGAGKKKKAAGGKAPKKKTSRKR